MPVSTTTPDRLGESTLLPGADVVPLTEGNTDVRDIASLNGWPVRSPVNASPMPSRATAHDSGADVDRYSFIAKDLHPLLLAGLPALRICFPVCRQHRT
jgi:hypothetical protein